MHAVLLVSVIQAAPADSEIGLNVDKSFSAANKLLSISPLLTFSSLQPAFFWQPQQLALLATFLVLIHFRHH